MLSIEIGGTTTQIVEMDYQARKPRIYRCIQLPTPEGAVTDGYLNDDKLEALRSAIKDTLKQNKVYTRKVIFTIFSSKIITREIVIPNVKSHQINALIEFNVNEYLPIDANDYKISHMRIGDTTKGDVNKIKVLVIAAEKTLIASYENLASQLKLNIVDIDYAGNSIFQAVSHNSGAGAIMTVNIEDENALVTIVRHSDMVLQRTVNIYNYNQLYQKDEAYSMLVGTILRLIDFSVSNNEDMSIDKIYLSGECSNDDSLMRLMTDTTHISCAPVGVIRGVNIGRKAENTPFNIFATAIGAGISSVGLDNEKERERHETNYVSASILMVILIISLAASLIVMSFVPYNAALIEQNILEAKRKQLEPAKVVYDQYNGMLDLIAKVRYGQALTHNSNDAIVDFLEELEDTLPSDVEVLDFSSTDTSCVMSLRVADKETAAGVINNFRNFESISYVSVTSISEVDKDGDEYDNTLVEFTINATYKVETLIEPQSSSTLTEDLSE
jgi:type IV pilus assembly protein PilM